MGSPVEILQEAAAKLAEAGQVPVSCLSGEDAIEWHRHLQRLQAQVGALICQGLAEVDIATMPAAETGRRTVAAVVAANTNANPKPLRADLRVGAWLQGLPVIAEAFAAGLIGRGHVDAIRRVENPRTQYQLSAAQEYLVEAAIGCDWNEFQAVLRYWELAFDPDGKEPKEQVEGRSCSYGKQADGTVRGRFNLDPLAGHAFITALEQQVQRLFRDDTETGSNRSATQRRADALVELATKGARRPDGTVPAPLVHITMSDGVAAANLALLAEYHLAGDATNPPSVDIGGGPSGDSSGPGHIDRRCELIDGVPLHPHFGIAALATATLRRLILNADSERLDLGREVRTFPQRLKQALLVKARGRCEEMGCDAPLAWLQADHLIPWSKGGRTSMENGQILCDSHNKAKRDQDPPPWQLE